MLLWSSPSPTAKLVDWISQKPRELSTGVKVRGPWNFEGSILPNSYAPTSACRRLTVKSGSTRLDWMLSKNVFCCSGFTVLILLKPRPRRPSELASSTKLSVISKASSMAWLLTVAPPILTISVPTMPAALDLSP